MLRPMLNSRASSREELSLLGYGFFGLLVLSSGMIAFAAVRYHWSRTSSPEADMASLPKSYDTAA